MLPIAEGLGIGSESPSAWSPTPREEIVERLLSLFFVFGETTDSAGRIVGGKLRTYDGGNLRTEPAEQRGHLLMHAEAQVCRESFRVRLLNYRREGRLHGLRAAFILGGDADNHENRGRVPKEMGFLAPPYVYLRRLRAGSGVPSVSGERWSSMCIGRGVVLNAAQGFARLGTWSKTRSGRGDGSGCRVCDPAGFA